VRLDPAGFVRLTATLPGQFLAGWRLGAAVRIPSLDRPPTLVVVHGLGGSAIAADLLRNLIGESLTIPLLVRRSPVLERPVLAGRPLVAVVSYSGDTAEAVAAFDGAVDRGVSAMVLTSGGRLADLAAGQGVPFVRLPHGLPPRLAAGLIAGCLAGILYRLGVSTAGGWELERAVCDTLALQRRWTTPASMAGGGGWRAAAAPRPCRRATHAVCDPGALAAALRGRICRILGVTGVTDAVARRWAAQLAENAKVCASAGELPEAAHNEVAGFDPSVAACLCLVVLRTDYDPEPVADQALGLTRLLAGHGPPVLTARAAGGSRAAQVLYLTCLGDWCSLWSAADRGADPVAIGPVRRLRADLRLIPDGGCPAGD